MASDRFELFAPISDAFAGQGENATVSVSGISYEPHFVCGLRAPMDGQGRSDLSDAQIHVDHRAHDNGILEAASSPMP